jgi:DNA-binding NtrC family response regulator
MATNSYTIFIVEDDPWYGEILEYHLSLNPDYTIHRFDDGRSCLDALHLSPDLITVDYSLPDMNGMELFSRIKKWNPDLPVVIISAQEEVGIAVELLREGAYDYLIKDDNTKDHLWKVVMHARENDLLRQKVDELQNELVTKYEFESTVIGNSPSIQQTFRLMEKAAKSQINVSVTGETGTGKEVVAKAIHYHSPRKKKPFVAVNMAAIPAELLESELFGHEKGAFTGAVARKIGRFEEANDGTIFLDEIAEMSPDLQSKLLRVLQERELKRVGGTELVKLNVRLIVATHQDLQKRVESGQFREDLYYRIMGLPIHLDPLRDRGKDIFLLTDHFLKEYAKENKTKKLILSESAQKKLSEYSFPGNIRELKAIIDLACVMADGDTIEAHDINLTNMRGQESFLQENKTLREYIRQIVSYALKRNNNNVVETARKLDVGKSTIYKMIKDNEINLDE